MPPSLLFKAMPGEGSVTSLPPLTGLYQPRPGPASASWLPVSTSPALYSFSSLEFLVPWGTWILPCIIYTVIIIGNTLVLILSAARKRNIQVIKHRPGGGQRWTDLKPSSDSFLNVGVIKESYLKLNLVFDTVQRAAGSSG